MPYWTYRANTGQRLAPYAPGVLPDLPDAPVMHYDASDISTLWQDSGRTTPVTADGDTVAAWDPVEVNGGSGNYITGSGEYVSDLVAGFGPGVKVTGGSFADQVAGTGGGAVPPGGASPRFVFAVVSSAGANPNSGQQPSIIRW